MSEVIPVMSTVLSVPLLMIMLTGLFEKVYLFQATLLIVDVVVIAVPGHSPSSLLPSLSQA